ncbi:hypothetical protein JTB14_025141 [Gonioctena quinquepunctata]|nr:hypothetical protein JTB14_025141 [Gonioctena quinquepunctata]
MGHRKNNVLLFGIPEDVSSLKDFVLDAASSIKGVRGSQVIRLGRFSTDKSRPAKLTLPKKLDVPVLIKNSKHLKSTEKYKGIYIRPDQTAMQRDHYLNIRKELNQRCR